MERFHIIFALSRTLLNYTCFISLYMLVNGESVQPYKALLKDAQVIKVQFIYLLPQGIFYSNQS